MTKKEKKIGIILLLLFWGLIISSLSIFIKNGIDNSQKASIGIMTYRGFPIAFSHYAPGMAWTKYDITTYLLNTILWCSILIGIYLIISHKINKKSH